MQAIDKETFFAALGFLAVLIKGENARENSAARAEAMAALIEMFCRTARPELKDAVDLDEIIESLKKRFDPRRLLGLASDPDLLHRLHARLQARQRAYAPDELIADEAAHLIEEEIKHAEEAEMKIVHIHGRKEIFAPYEALATAIADILKDKGSCAPGDLQNKGFAPEEIHQNWPLAYALANVDLMEG